MDYSYSWLPRIIINISQITVHNYKIKACILEIVVTLKTSMLCYFFIMVASLKQNKNNETIQTQSRNQM